jgi:hypothetical protein
MEKNRPSTDLPYPIEEIESMARDCGLTVEQVVSTLYLKETAKARRLTDDELADALIWNVWVDINPKKCAWPFALMDEAIARLRERK